MNFSAYHNLAQVRFGGRRIKGFEMIAQPARRRLDQPNGFIENALPGRSKKAGYFDRFFLAIF